MTYYGAAELARSYRTVRKNTIAVAEDIPENQYDFRATPGSRSVREVIAHLLSTSQGSYGWNAVEKICSFETINFPAVIRERQETEKALAPKSKAELVQMLKDDGEKWGAFLESVPESELAVIVTFSPQAQPPTKSRFEMLLSVKEHEMHHRAQLMLIERMLGIVPHLTREREARMAGR